MPTPIILNGNNSALGSLGAGIGNALNNWADAYATQVLQEQYRKRKNTEVAKTAKDYNLDVSIDANGNLIAKPKEIVKEDEIWQPAVLPSAMYGYEKGTHILLSNKSNIKIDKDYYDLANKDKEVAAKVTNERFKNIQANLRSETERAEELEDYEAKKKIDAQYSNSTQKEESIPSAMEDFEKTNYGKLVPQLRGTDGYKQNRLNWINQTKEAGVTDTAKMIQADNLREEFNKLPEVENYKTINTQFEVMTKALKESQKTNNFVAVDQAIITLYNKMTDPQSVVRESEYARTQTDLALWNRLKGKIEKWQAGGAGLTQEDRNSIYRMAKEFNKVYKEKYSARVNEYRGYINNWDQDPDNYLSVAPASALAHLKVNPSTIGDFEAKYGYRPKGY